jgi:hypothetical protein
LTGVIVVPPHDPWKLAGWGYRLVLDSLLDHIDARGDATAAQDRFTIKQARALAGLNFDLLLEADRDQATRLAGSLHTVAVELQPQLRSGLEERDRGLAEALAQLERQLLEFLEVGYVHIMRMRWGTAGKMPRFMVDGRDYTDGAAVRAVMKEARRELSARRIPAEIETRPITTAEHGPMLPSWQEFRQRPAWQQNQPPPWPPS